MFMDPFVPSILRGWVFTDSSRAKATCARNGVIFDSNGYIVTNNHVIDHASTVEIMLNDKKVFKAKESGPIRIPTLPW